MLDASYGRDLTVAVIGAIIAGLVLEAPRLKQWLAERNAPLTGEWMENLAAVGDQEPRHDIVTCRQRGQFVDGDIQRISPGNQTNRTYRFRGTIAASGEIYCAFWPTNRVGERGSYGTIQMAPSGKDSWSGYYISLLRERVPGREPTPLDPFTTNEMSWTLRKR